MQVQLQQGTWEIGARIGSGGFGRVFQAWASASEQAAAKFIPKAHGADRELLFTNLTGICHIVPILDSGETDDDWVLVMPRAQKSLRQHLEEIGTPLGIAEAVAVLQDIAATLADLDGDVVHRDLKPDNVLLLDGRWCLADFGISRYAEATTSPDTQKCAWSAPYAAPERWRGERATIATDVYSLGVIAYELLSGHRPFTGSWDDLREAHLHESAPHLTTVPAALAALVEECLYKSSQARPSTANLVLRLARAAEQAPSPGLAALQEANRAEAIRVGEGHRTETAAQSDQERRDGLFEAAKTSFTRISTALKDALLDAAPAASVQGVRGGGWEMQLGAAKLTVADPKRTAPEPWDGWDPPAFEVIAHSDINICIPEDQHGYRGREHSLWFCDAAPGGAYSYQWFETAFIIMAFSNKRAQQDPFGLDPGIEAAKALWNGIAEFQMAWPFTPLTVGDLDEFIGRWAGWFALASQGRLSHPSLMPERRPEGSFRQT